MVYGATMRPKQAAPALEPTDTVTSIFTARRDLVQGVKSVLAGSNLTVPEADLLVSLFGVRELGWEDLPHDTESYVAFKELELYLVHNPSLLSRRIRKLADAKPPLVEVAEAQAGSGLHFNALRVHITAEGVRRIRPVWERFSRMSAKLGGGHPAALAGGPPPGQPGNQRPHPGAAAEREGLFGGRVTTPSDLWLVALALRFHRQARTNSSTGACGPSFVWMRRTEACALGWLIPSAISAITASVRRCSGPGSVEAGGFAKRISRQSLIGSPRSRADSMSILSTSALSGPIGSPEAPGRLSKQAAIILATETSSSAAKAGSLLASMPSSLAACLAEACFLPILSTFAIRASRSFSNLIRSLASASFSLR
jgi:hypothetical protein